MRDITCRCERSFEAELPDEIDLDAEPGRLDQILAGDFFALTCPHCGERIKPELRVRFRSRRLRLDLLVLPELERLAFYLGKTELPRGFVGPAPASGPAGTQAATGEILVGYAELFERARILKDGLDPEAVELAKYWIRVQAEEKAPEGAAVSVAYAGRTESPGEGERLRFHVGGLRPDTAELAVLPLPRAQYERLLKDKRRALAEEPFDRLFKGSYRSVRALEIPTEEKA